MTAEQIGRQLLLRVQAEKLQLLFNQSFPAIFISLLNAILLTVILWPVQDQSILISWLGTLTASSIIRLLIFIRYWQIRPDKQAILAWEKPYFASLVFSSLIWGVGALFLMPADSPVHQVLILYFLMGMSGGAISVYSAHRAMTLTTLACVLLPAIIWFYLQGSLLSVGAAIAASIFFISAIRSGKVLSRAMHQSFSLTHELKNAKEAAEQMAYTDELTGLANRRAFYEHGAMFAGYCQRNDDRLSIAIMDIDHFKQVNDTHGHSAGDAALKQVAQILQRSIRSTDICARIGGEEFAILVLASSLPETILVAEKLRKEIADTPVLFNQQEFHIYASFGVASDDYDLDSLVQKADTALYQAKENGRNRVAWIP